MKYRKQFDNTKIFQHVKKKKTFFFKHLPVIWTHSTINHANILCNALNFVDAMFFIKNRFLLFFSG